MRRINLIKLLLLQSFLVYLLLGCTRSDELEAKDHIINDLQSQITQYEDDTELLSGEINQLKEDKHQLQATLNKIQDEKDNLLNHYNKMMQENKQQLGDLQSQLTEKESQIGELQSQNRYYRSYFEPTIDPNQAEASIKDITKEAITAIKNNDWDTIANLAHPNCGIRFTPSTTVSLDIDMVLHREQLLKFKEDEERYFWGYYDGKGSKIMLAPSEYWARYIYDADFIHAEQVSYNKPLGKNNNLNNQFLVYQDAIIVEYHFSGFENQYEGLDWKSLNLVYQQYRDQWYLVGIVHNEWTI